MEEGWEVSGYSKAISSNVGLSPGPYRASTTLASSYIYDKIHSKKYSYRFFSKRDEHIPPVKVPVLKLEGFLSHSKSKGNLEASPNKISFLSLAKYVPSKPTSVLSKHQLYSM